jgi:glycosyltransferase involved in cell wall biosynthesis
MSNNRNHTSRLLQQSIIQQPAVSFVISAYNAAPFIRETVQSILDQPGPPFELIIINDASTDKTLNVLQNFDDPRITLLHLETRVNVSQARNLACEHIRAPWMCVFDADDTMLPNAFAPFFHHVTSQPFAQCGYCALQFTDAAGRPIDHEMRNRFDFIKMLRTNILPHPMALIKTSLLRKIGGYDNRLASSVDYDLWLKIIEWADPVFYNKYGVAYRRHPGGIGNTNKDHSDVINLLRERIATPHPDPFAEHRRNAIRLGMRFWDAIDAQDKPQTIALAQALDLTGIRSFILDHHHARALILSRHYAEAQPLCDYWFKFLQSGGFLNAAEAVSLSENALLAGIGPQDTQWLRRVVPVAAFTQQHLHAPVLGRYLQTAQSILNANESPHTAAP